MKTNNHYSRASFTLLPATVLLLSLAGTVIPAQGQTFNVVADIPQVPGVQQPAAQKIVQGRNGDLYSTSTGGEDQAVYSLTLTGTDTKVSDIFRGGNGGVTLGTDGNLYGTSPLGGTGTCGFYGCGYAWQLTPSGTLTTLYSFQGTPDGCKPTAAPVQAPSGLFYGATPYNCNGGGDYGIIYSLTSSGTYNRLHTFSGSDGAQTVAPLTIGPDGNIYGGTQAGGTNNLGVLFRITPGGTYTVLHNFAGTAASDGWDVESGMTVGSDGKLYGVTYRGGTGGIGVIFTLTTSGTYTIIAQVPQPGTPPTTSLVQGTDGKFYGIFGTGSSGANGVIYSVTTAGTITYLHSFCQETNCTDGYGPSTPMVQATDGKFYGVTSGGGISGNCMCGVFYSFDVGLGPFVSLVSTSGKEGAQIGILGQGFTGASVVKFGGTQATTIHRSGATFISATVPAAALTGSVTVTTGATTLTSNNTFRVTPTFPSFNPTSGPVGTPVVLTGTGLAQTTKVTFGRVAATTVTVNSDTQVTANVPTGARTGKITITTAGGSVTSRTVFTVN